jgi:hypothetical protein
MFPHKYTTESDADAYIEHLNTLYTWTKTACLAPIDFRTLPVFKWRAHPHAKDPRVIREFIAMHKYYEDIWFKTINI